MHAEVPHAFISKEDAEIFSSALEAVLSELSFLELKDLYLFTNKKVDLIKEICIVISFDGDWQPFLGHTRGYNNSSKPARLQIASPSRVLDVSREWLRLGRPRDTGRGRQQHAGRVFVTRDRLLCDDQTLGTWQWDAGNPVERLRRFYDDVEKARLDEKLRVAMAAAGDAKRKEWDRDPAAKELLFSAKQLFQRIEREDCFDQFCRGFDWQKQFAIDEALRAGIRECVLAKLKGEIGESLAEEALRSSARERLQRTGQEDMFQEISRRISTMRVREVTPPVLANSRDELQSLQPICDDLFKVLRPRGSGSV